MVVGGVTVALLGDTAYGQAFQAIARRAPGIHVALVPVGNFYPRCIFARYHVDPGQALDIFRFREPTT